jgi:uncharacterized protein YdeI (YjbR/CyaY-like superfamily)
MVGEEIETFYPRDRLAWREWLQENYKKKQSIWLIYYKKNLNMPTLAYSEAADKALCNFSANA